MSSSCFCLPVKQNVNKSADVSTSKSSFSPTLNGWPTPIDGSLTGRSATSKRVDGGRVQRAAWSSLESSEKRNCWSAGGQNKLSLSAELCNRLMTLVNEIERQIQILSFICVRISFVNTSFDSSWRALSLIFWVQGVLSMHSAVNRQISRTISCVFIIFLQSNGCSDRIKSKMLKTAVFKSYRLMYLEMKLRGKWARYFWLNEGLLKLTIRQSVKRVV